MPRIQKDELKTAFEAGKTPTGQDFENLIDTLGIVNPDSGDAPTVPTAASDVVVTGTDTLLPVNSAGVKAHVDARRASDTEADVGSSHDKLMTPLRTKEVVDKAKSQLMSTIQTAENTLNRTINTKESATSDTIRSTDSRLTTAIQNTERTINTKERTLNTAIQQARTSLTSVIGNAARSVLTTLQGGISTSYNTLQKLYTYLNTYFYTKLDADQRFFNKNTDTLRGSKIVNQTITNDKLSAGINGSKITTGTLKTERLAHNTQVAIRHAHTNFIRLSKNASLKGNGTPDYFSSMGGRMRVEGRLPKGWISPTVKRTLSATAESFRQNVLHHRGILKHEINIWSCTWNTAHRTKLLSYNNNLPFEGMMSVLWAYKIVYGSLNQSNDDKENAFFDDGWVLRGYSAPNINLSVNNASRTGKVLIAMPQILMGYYPFSGRPQNPGFQDKYPPFIYPYLNIDPSL